MIPGPSVRRNACRCMRSRVVRAGRARNRWRDDGFLLPLVGGIRLQTAHSDMRTVVAQKDRPVLKSVACVVVDLALEARLHLRFAVRSAEEMHDFGIGPEGPRKIEIAF